MNMPTTELAKTDEWYTAMIEECNAIRVEKSKIVQEELVEMYLLIGARILENEGNAPMRTLVTEASKDLHIGETNLFYGVSLARKYGTQVNNLPIEGAAISWTKAKALVALPGKAGDSDFDPYEFARKFFATHDPKDSQKVGTDLLRLYRERNAS